MKNLRKPLSVLLALVMMLSVVSAAFSTFAVGSSAEAKLEALAIALRNSTVGTLTNYQIVTTPNKYAHPHQLDPSAGDHYVPTAVWNATDDVIAYDDASDSIFKAAEALRAVVLDVADMREGKQNTTATSAVFQPIRYNNARDVKAKILLLLQDSTKPWYITPADVTAYNIPAVLDRLMGNPTNIYSNASGTPIVHPAGLNGGGTGGANYRNAAKYAPACEGAYVFPYNTPAETGTVATVTLTGARHPSAWYLPGNKVATVTIKRSMENALQSGKPNSIGSIPDTVSTDRRFTWTHAAGEKSWYTGSGTGAIWNYARWHYLSSVSGAQSVASADGKAYKEILTIYNNFFTKTIPADLNSLSETALIKLLDGTKDKDGKQNLDGALPIRDAMDTLAPEFTTTAFLNQIGVITLPEADAILAALFLAANVARYKPFVAYFEDLVSKGTAYESLPLNELQALRAQANRNWAVLAVLRDDPGFVSVRQGLEDLFSWPSFVPETQAWLNALNYFTNVAELEAYKDWFDDKIANTDPSTMSGADITALWADAVANYEAVKSYNAGEKATVFPGGFQDIEDFIALLEAELDTRFLSYKDMLKFFNPKQLNYNIGNMSKAVLLKTIEDFEPEIAALLAIDPTDLAELYTAEQVDAIMAYWDALYAEASARAAAGLDTMTAVFLKYGGKINQMNWKDMNKYLEQEWANIWNPNAGEHYADHTFSGAYEWKWTGNWLIKDSFSAVEYYDVLRAVDLAANADMVFKYNTVKQFVTDFQEFYDKKGLLDPDGTGGYYSSSNTTQQNNPSPRDIFYPESISRDNDVIRIADGEYVVTEDKLDESIAKLDKFLAQDIKLLMPDFDLQDTIGQVLMGVLNEDLLNTILTALYAPIAQLIDDMVQSMDLSGDGDSSAVTPANLGFFAKTTELASVMNNTAVTLDNTTGGFPKVRAELASVPRWPQVMKYGTNLAPDNGQFNLDWQLPSLADIQDPAKPHVTYWAYIYRWIDALGNALAGAVHLFRGSLANTNVSLQANVGMNMALLQVRMEGRAGYQKWALPLLEALGATQKPNAAGSATTPLKTSSQFIADWGTPTTNLNYMKTTGMFHDILDPLFWWVMNDLAKAPIATLTKAIPNLAWAVEMDMVSMGIAGAFDTEVLIYSSGSMGANVIDPPMVLPITDLLDINDIVAAFGIKGLNSASDLLTVIIQMATGDDSMKIPSINTGFASSLGTMVQKQSAFRNTSKDVDIPSYPGTGGSHNTPAKTGKPLTNNYNYIEANKADVFISLLRWIFKAAKDEKLINSLFPPADPTAPPSGGLDIDIGAILAMLANVSQDQVICALVELLVPQFYNQTDIVYPTGDAGKVLSSVLYTPIWTEKKANYVAKRLDVFAVNVVQLLFGWQYDDLNKFMQGVVEPAIFSDATLHSIIGMITGMLDALPAGMTLDSIIDMLVPFLPAFDNFNAADLEALLKYLKDYDPNEVFNINSQAEFMDKLYDLLLPFVPLLRVFLAGEVGVPSDTDPTGTESLGIGNGLLEAKGYPGYANGLIPILEAIGCKGLVDPATFTGLDDRAMLAAIVDPIFGLLDDFLAEPTLTLVDLLANLIYFANNGLLQDSLDNLLTPVYVLLDVVRPIFDLNFYLTMDLNTLVTDLIASLGLAVPVLQLNELLAGTVYSYTSANGLDAVRLNLGTLENKADFLTALLRTLVSTLLFGDNINRLEKFIRKCCVLNGAEADAIMSLVKDLALLSTDSIINVLFYIFFIADGEVQEWKDQIIELNDITKRIYKKVGESSSPTIRFKGEVSKIVLNKYFGNIFNETGVAPNGFIAFFASIGNFFKKLFGIA